MQLIVLGMHRSGTSSVTRLLNLAGAYFGPEGIATAPNEENPKGFWERRDVRGVCDALLAGGGFDWWRVAGFSTGRIPTEVRDQQRDAFRAIVHELDAHRPWVVKEPRLCLVAPVLRPALEAPVYIHVGREPLEVAESLAARNGFPVPVGVALWETYTIHALAASAGEPRLFVSYGSLMADPVATTARLVEQLGEIGVQGLRMPTEREITAFVTPSLHRQHRSAGDRRTVLSAAQAELADAADAGEVAGALDALSVSDGAVATLEAFEAHEALRDDAHRVRSELEQLQVESAATLAQAREAHRVAAEELEAERVVRARTATELDELRHEHTELSERMAESVLAHGAALDAVDDAAKRLRRVKGSGAVRMAARASALRSRLKRDPNLGVDAAVNATLRQLDQARSLLQGAVERSRPAPPPPPDEPRPVPELRARRRAARAQGDRPKVAVLAWDLGHNPFGRAHLLADLVADRFDVELWGPQFDRYGSDIWLPVRDTRLPVRRFPGTSFPGFLDTLEDMARRIDADAIYVSKPRLPSLALGVLAKQLWNRPLIVDVDDFEPSFFGEAEGIPVGALGDHRDDPDLLLPFGRLWTRACETVVSDADRITVSNQELEARYGGVVVPHARDESVFDPERFDRAAVRRRLGLDDDHRLVLFGGTPRAHKGIVQLLEAVDRLGDQRVRVGVFRTRELDELRRDIGALERWILPLPVHAFAELPSLLAAADLTCALQAPDHPVARFQMPAKVTDAMAMGVPCLVTPVPPLQPLLDKDVLEVFDGDVPLHERLRSVLQHPEETADRARRARELFLESYSYAAVRPAVTTAIEEVLDDPPPLGAALGTLVEGVRGLFRPGPAARLGGRHRAVPAGATYDLVMLWKQNDTGIYGRRQDMFLKHLERSGRFGNIVHLDNPISAEALAVLARGSRRNGDQNRLVLQQTLRRIAHRGDHGSVQHRTFVYAAGRASRALRLPRRDEFPAYVRSVLQRGGGRRRPLMVWVYPTSPFAPALIDVLDPEVVVADVVDDNRTWYEPGTPGFTKAEASYAEILARSDVVLANCEAVATSMRAFAPLVHVVANACELPDGGERPARPAELAGLHGPVIGYAGNLSDRIDLALLRSVARARPSWNLVLMGSAHLDKAVLGLAEEPNVRFLGTQPYDHAREIMRHFDVGLIPHLDNEMTRSMNPLKAYVYCSLGVPVVSTPIANIDEMADLITVAETPEAFVAAIEAALAAGHRVPDADALRPHSWDERVERVLELVDEFVTSRATGPL